MGLNLDINMTTILSSAIAGAINGIAVFLAVRYMGKIVDKLEKDIGKKVIIPLPKRDNDENKSEDK